jgi:hypothetical protein
MQTLLGKFAKSLGKNSKSKVPWIRLNKSGLSRNLRWTHLRKPTKSRSLMRFSIYLRITWQHFLRKRRLSFTTRSKQLSSNGKTFCKISQRPWKCYSKFRGNGYTLRVFSPPSSKNQKNNYLVISVNSKLFIKGLLII